MSKRLYGVTFHPKWWYKNEGICFTKEFFDDPEYRIDCDIKMRKALYERFGQFGIGEKNPEARPLLGSDLLAAGYMQSELLGCPIIYAEDDSPAVISINKMDIDAVDLDKNPVWERTQKQIDYLLDKYGRVETFVNTMGVQNIAIDLYGSELFLAYYNNPDEVRVLLKKITDLLIAVGKRFYALSTDISGGSTEMARIMKPECYLTGNCSVEMISEKTYIDFLLPYDQMLADAFGSLGMHHCGATMEHVVRGYSKIKGLSFVEVGAFSDIAEVRKVLPGIPMNARYSPVKLINASYDEIHNDVEKMLKAGKTQQGNFSISCVGIGDQVSDRQVTSFLKACSSIL